MARRLFNGNRFSENGWPYVDEGSCTWIVVPGTNPPVHLQIQNGPPLSLLGAWAADWNAYIEPLRDADSACFTQGNSVSTSNHPGGTAVDLDWDSHKFQVRGTLNAAQMAVMAEMEDFYEGNVFWAGRWQSPVDEMHSQVGYDTYDQDADRPFPKVFDFIARKIRADGFSTFRRGGAPGIPAQPPVVEPAQPALAIGILSRATGITTAKAQEILQQVSFALVKAECTNPRRIAAALAQWVVESGHFVYTEEIADGPESEERWKYKGRTWIQLTWLENYRGFSEWCHSLGLVPTPDYFVVRPHELAEQKWAALGPAYWWAIKYPRINEYADRGDIDNVSKWVNAPAWVDNPNKHANGEKERRDACNRALVLGDQLLTLIDPGDDMAQIPQAEWAEALDLLRQGAKFRRPSLSAFRHVGEGDVNTCMGFAWSADGSTHVQLVERLAVEYGDPTQVALLMEVAAADVVKFPDRAWDAKLAARVLTKVSDAAKAEATAQIKAWLAAEAK